MSPQKIVKALSSLLRPPESCSHISCCLHSVVKSSSLGASLVAQWLSVCLSVQGTRVQALVWEDPACRGAAGPVSHNC